MGVSLVAEFAVGEVKMELASPLMPLWMVVAGIVVVLAILLIGALLVVLLISTIRVARDQRAIARSLEDLAKESRGAPRL